MTDKCFHLGEFLQEAHDRMQGHNNDNGEEIAAAVIAQHPSWNSLCLNAPLNGEMEEQIFNALVSSSQIMSLVIPPNVQVASVEVMLHKAIPALPKLKRVHLAISLTETQAETILAILQTSPTLDQVCLFMTHCGDGIAKPIAKYLRESSSLRILAMSWEKLDENEHFAAPMSQTSLSTIFEGICDCRSFKGLAVHEPPPIAGHANVVAESLAWAISKSASLKKYRSYCPLMHRAFLGKIGSALLHTEAVKSFDLCFREREFANGLVLTCHRTAPWKPLLSKDIPLALWPYILAKTNTWDKETSHQPLDALFFLVKEKCDVLLQNVRRRKIRKRKRFQISL
jgi:hypothetical protein